MTRIILCIVSWQTYLGKRMSSQHGATQRG
jgi:hypothetical protein